MNRRSHDFKDGTSWVAAQLLHDDLTSVLQKLSERDAGVVQLRFGLIDEEPRTLAEIAEFCGISREQVRQIERRAMSRLRHPTRSQFLRGCLDDGDAGSSAAMRHACNARQLAGP